MKYHAMLCTIMQVLLSTGTGKSLGMPKTEVSSVAHLKGPKGYDF